MKNLAIITNDNDFNPIYTVVDLDSMQYQTREIAVSKDEAARKGYKVLRQGKFPHAVICEVTTDVSGSNHLAKFRTLKAAKAFVKTEKNK